MKITLRALQLPLFVIAPALFSACAGNAADDDALVSESASLALSSEDVTAEDSTADALGGMATEETSDAADEAIDGETSLDELPGEGALSCDFSATRAAVMQRFDDDGNGRLDQAERAALRAEVEGRGLARTFRHRLLGLPGRRPHYHVWARVRWAFDVDNDHQLSAEERAAMISALEDRCERRRARLVEQYDADGDGALSREEIAQAVADARAAFRAHRQEILAQYDVNQDGTLDETERAAVRADRQARIAARRAEVMAEYDANGDGQLDAAERDALKAAIRTRIAEGPNA